MLTLREEILKNSGLLTEENKDYSQDRRWINYFRNMFDDLLAKAVEKSGKEFDDFVGSEEYRKWVKDELSQLFKNESVKKIFDKWEQDLLFDLD